MIDFDPDTDNSAELPKIAERIANSGGSVVAFRQTYSFILFTTSRMVYEYLPPGRSPIVAGTKHAVISLLCGPWSGRGPFVTLHALMVNLSGGIDVTHEIGSRPDGVFLPLESLELDAHKKEKAIQYGFAAILYGVLGVLIWRLVIPEWDPTIWSPGYLTTLSVTVVLVIITGVIVSRFRK